MRHSQYGKIGTTRRKGGRAWIVPAKTGNEAKHATAAQRGRRCRGERNYNQKLCIRFCEVGPTKPKTRLLSIACFTLMRKQGWSPDASLCST